MLLTNAIRKSGNLHNLNGVETSGKDLYKENVVAVNTFIVSVLSSSIPPLKKPPSNMAQFAETYTLAQANALKWTNSVAAKLLEIPKDVLESDETIQKLFNDSIVLTKQLIKEPENSSIKSVLMLNLRLIAGTLNTVTMFIEGAVNSISAFRDVMPALAGQLTSIATHAIETEKVDKKKIDQLQQDIDRLNRQITSDSLAIAAAGVVTGGAIIGGLIFTIAAWPIGALSWFALGPVAVAGGVAIGFAAKDIIDCKKKIEQDQKDMDDYTADVATLQILANNFTTLAQQAVKIDNNLRQILGAWKSLELNVTAAVEEIEAAQKSADENFYQDVLADLNAASLEWQSASQKASDLVLDMKMNDATLELGMTQQDVEKAMARGKVIDFVKFCNNIGTYPVQ